MQADPLYAKFIKRWEEVTELPPQNVGFFTPVYKRTVRFLKVDPWRILLPVSLMIIAAIVLAFEITAAQIASLLQQGF